jgi:hypothetical protein
LQYRILKDHTGRDQGLDHKANANLNLTFENKERTRVLVGARLRVENWSLVQLRRSTSLATSS